MVSEQEIPGILSTCLQIMDEEATSMVKGWPTRLSWYGGHAGKPKRTEPSWSARICQLLKSKHEVNCETEVKYPARPRERCDLVIPLSSGKFWIEVKGAW